MTLAMCAEILFLPTKRRKEKILLRKISSCQIELSWKLLCGTAEIVIPRNIKYFEKQNVKEVFQKGDPCEIYLGYGGNLSLEFKGYINQVSADYPVTIKLEDEMWRLKQIPVNFSSSNIKLKDFIKKFVTDFPVDIDGDLSLGAVRFSKTTLGEVLTKLQNDMSVYSFIRDGKLTIAKPFSDVKKDGKDTAIAVFDLERNCVDNNLNYISAEDRLVKIIGKTLQNTAKAVRNKEKDKKLTFEWGDNNPVETINWTFQVKTAKELEDAVKNMYKMRKKDGYDGTFTSFGIPSVQHGQKVQLLSTLYPDRKGVYYIDRVKKTFGKDAGYKQEIELGQTASVSNKNSSKN